MRIPISIFLCSLVPVLASPLEAWPYWPEYEKTPLDKIVPQEWRTSDDVIDGWDWSLPPELQAAPSGLLAVQRTGNMDKSLSSRIDPLDLPVNPTLALWIKWQQIEPVEGQFRFDTLK